MIIHKVFDLIDEGFELVLWFYDFFSLSIFFCELLCVSLCSCDVFIRDVSWSLNCYFLRFSSRFFLCMYLEDSVCIDIKGYFDLRLPSSHWRDSFEVEHSKWFIVSWELSFSLSYMYGYCILVIYCSSIDVWFFCRDSRVSWDHYMSNTSFYLYCKRERSYIEQENILYISLDDSPLNRGSLSYWFIRIYSWLRFFSKDFVYDLLYFKHSSWSSYKDNVVDFRFIELWVWKRWKYRIFTSIEKVCSDVFKLSSGKCFI